jgi:cell division protein FtsI/penicillin-binding protein 2
MFGYALMKTPGGESGSGPVLTLTLDALMQIRLEKAMGDFFEKSGAKAATGIIMDVQTGEVLAVANFPNFDPNEYYRFHTGTAAELGVSIELRTGIHCKSVPRSRASCRACSHAE